MRAAAERDSPYLKLLGKLSDVQVMADLPEDAVAAVQVVSDARLMLHVEVDRAAEVSRLDKEIQQIEGKIGGLASRLDKPEFVSKAPPQVIAQQRTQLEQFRTNLDKLQEQRRRLAK
jgi:valyl-tRNA synthetase